MNNNNGNTSRSIGFCGLLTLAFIVLRLTGVIGWSWVWVLAPVWMPCLAAVLIVCAGAVGALYYARNGSRIDDEGK